MQHAYTYATTLPSLRKPVREAVASARERLGQFWDRIRGRIDCHRAWHELLALDEHMRSDIGLMGADAPRSIEPERSSRMCAGAWGWSIGTFIRPGFGDAYPCRAPRTGRREYQRSALPSVGERFEWMSH